MSYRIRGLEADRFRPFFALDEAALAARRARLVTADSDRGFPCRVSLEEAGAGERLLLVNFVSQPAHSPFHASHAIFVREGAAETAEHRDCVPPMLDRRALGLRAFDAEGMIVTAREAAPGRAGTELAALLERPDVESVHMHNLVLGCFLARAERP